MDKRNGLEKLFGGKARVAILTYLFNSNGRKASVNEIVRKAVVNPNLASTELKKLAEIGILKFKKIGNVLVYEIDESCLWFESLKSIFEKNEWSQWERPARIHHLLLTLEAGLKPMKEYYGYCFPEAHLIFNYDNVTWFFKPKEFIESGQKLVPIYLKRKDKIWKDFEEGAEKLWQCKDYKSFYKNYIEFWKVAYITELISFYIDSLLASGESITINEKSFTNEYEEKLWTLAKEAEKVGLDKIDLKPIVTNYFWIRNSYHSIHRLSKEEVKIEVEKKMGKRKPIIKKGTDPKSISKELLQVGKDMILMQDKRKMYMMRAAGCLHDFLKEIGKKDGLTPLMMDQSLPIEVLKIKKLSGLKDKLILRQRLCTITGSLKEGINVFDGQMIFPNGKSERVRFEIRGNVACGGKAVGRVKVVNRAEEIYKVNHGDVVVAPMTSPDFMPALRKCVAIVTNFGGITCHAAIISREFNIPCVVGTNNATEILKDGDLVEVDADNGIVKILNQV